MTIHCSLVEHHFNINTRLLNYHMCRINLCSILFICIHFLFCVIFTSLFVDIIYLSVYVKATVAMGPCSNHARCYVQSLPSEPNHSSNGRTDGIRLLLLSVTVGTGQCRQRTRCY
jgi:hypothetical protein